MRKYILYLFSLLTLMVLTACGSSGGSSTSINTPVPGGSVTTTLTIVKTTLSSNETTTVTATFTDNGKPMAGLPVTFSVTPGMAVLNPANGQVTTDQNGVAGVVMTAANTTGVAELTVSALINGTSVTKTSPFFVNTQQLHLGTPKFGDTQTSSVAINGGGSTIVSVEILDANGKRYTEQDVDVYFNGNLGTFLVDNAAVNAVGKVRSSGGFARATYTYSGTVSTNLIDSFTVTLGSSTVTGYITITPLGVTNITYSSSTPAGTSLLYGEAKNLTFTVTDSKGTTIPNQIINFTIGGTAAGSKFVKNDGTLVDTISVTSDIFGVVTTTLKAGTTSTNLWVTAALASGTQSVAQSPVITVSSTTPAALVAGAPSKTTLNYGEGATVSFTVTNAAGAALPGQVVTFSVVDTTGTASSKASLVTSQVTTNSSGVATASLYAGTSAAIVRVKAVVGNLSTQSANMTISSGVPSALALSIGTLNVTAWTGTTASLINPTAESAITVRANDALGQAAANVLINFTTTGGAFKGSPSCTTGADGSCTVTWINSNPAIPASGLATVTATSAGGATTSGTIVMASAQAQITSNCNTVAFVNAASVGSNSSQSCNVTVKDLLGNAMGSGATVAFTVTTKDPTKNTYAVTPANYTYPNTNAVGGVTLPIVITKTNVLAAGGGTGILTVTVTSGGVNTVSVIDLN